jgi:hypothetical protein
VVASFEEIVISYDERRNVGVGSLGTISIGFGL